MFVVYAKLATDHGTTSPHAIGNNTGTVDAYRSNESPWRRPCYPYSSGASTRFRLHQREINQPWPYNSNNHGGKTAPPRRLRTATCPRLELEPEQLDFAIRDHDANCTNRRQHEQEMTAPLPRVPREIKGVLNAESPRVRFSLTPLHFQGWVPLPFSTPPPIAKSTKRPTLHPIVGNQDRSSNATVGNRGLQHCHIYDITGRPTRRPSTIERAYKTATTSPTNRSTKRQQPPRCSYQD